MRTLKLATSNTTHKNRYFTSAHQQFLFIVSITSINKFAIFHTIHMIEIYVYFFVAYYNNCTPLHKLQQ